MVKVVRWIVDKFKVRIKSISPKYFWFNYNSWFATEQFEGLPEISLRSSNWESLEMSGVKYLSSIGLDNCYEIFQTH